MLKGIADIAAVCVGLLGLIGAAATTGMPMWKVTAFIGENIIVMETRWEGLWMNCYRQANIRMQCKVYDSLLFLPPELQAARGLMCCSLALSGLGLLVAFAGMKCVSCVQNDRAKTIILMVAGGMQLLASVCVFIPVSWTGHAIIRDFYNPLLIDAQRRELGEALYIGWVTGGVLFASAMLFLCRKMPSEKGSFDVYHPAVNLLRYKQQPNQAPMMRYHPISTISSLSASPNSVSIGSQQALPFHGSQFNPAQVYNQGLPERAAMQYQTHLAHQSSMRSSSHPQSMYTPGNSLYMSQSSMPMTHTTQTGDPSTSYGSSFYPVPQTPVFVGYNRSIMRHPSAGSSGMYI